MNKKIILAIAVVIISIASAGFVYMAKVDPVPVTYNDFGVMVVGAQYENGQLEIYFGYTGPILSNDCVARVFIPFDNATRNGNKTSMEYLYVQGNENENYSIHLKNMADESTVYTWCCYITIDEAYVKIKSYFDGKKLQEFKLQEIPGLTIGLSSLANFGVITGEFTQHDVHTAHGGTLASVVYHTPSVYYEKQTNGTIEIRYI